jgi:import inner membrane translocase subunit TIM23
MNKNDSKQFILALIYSLIGTGVSWVRGVDDELNTVISGGLTGLLYRSTAGLKGALRGSLYGVGVSSLYVLLTSKERLQTYI